MGRFQNQGAGAPGRPSVIAIVGPMTQSKSALSGGSPQVALLPRTSKYALHKLTDRCKWLDVWSLNKFI